MKKLFFLVLLMALMASCTNVNKQQQVVAGQDSIRKIEPEFFYVVTDTVKSGDNTWNRAKYFYGSGYDWKYIVSRNKFLQEPGRVWQDKATGIWYVLIRPGEVLDVANVFVPGIVFADTIHSQPKLQSKPNLFEPEPFPWWCDFPWGWMLLFLSVLAIATKLSQIYYKETRKNPVTAGPPQVNGGVKDNEAYSRMNQVAQNRFPGAQIVIKNIRRGWLSGWAKVFYANDKTKKLKIKDVAAYAGEATINGIEQTIYFLQGCGNDARQGNYMTGILEFRSDVIINSDGSESPLPIIETPTSNVTREEEPVLSSLNPGSELFQIAGEHAMIVEEFLKNQVAHKVTMEYTTPDGGIVKTVFETKNETQKSSQDFGKKEEKDK